MNSERMKRGPKRSEESRQAILKAAYDLTAEHGYGALTIEGIAARAGCGKQTVYRWWHHKADVLLEALALKADLRIPTEGRGSYREDMTSFLADSFALLQTPGIAPALRALMAEAQIDPDFRARLRPFLDRRRAALRTITDRAHERGELFSELDSEHLADLVFGFIWYRILATDDLPSTRDIDALLVMVGATSSKKP